MKPRFSFRVLIVLLLLVLTVTQSAGLALAAPAGAALQTSASRADDPPGASSAPSGIQPAVVSPSVPEVAPATVAGPDAPDAPYNRSLRYVGSAFKPRENDVNYAVTPPGGACVYVTSGDALEVWNVPLSLPNGVQVQWLRMYYYDTNTGTAMRGWFSKYDLYGNIVDEWGVDSHDVVPSGFGYWDVQIDPPETINYDAYSYVINWRPYAAGSNLRLCGFRLFYYQAAGPQFLPLIRKQ